MSETLSESQSEILDAAAACFMKLGVRVASVDDIARSLGSTKGRIYHHFVSKGALLGAVRLQAPKFTRQAVAPVIDGTLPPGRNFHNMALAHVAAVFRTLPYHKVVMQHYTGLEAKSASDADRAMEARIQAANASYEDLFRAVIRAGMEHGEFRRQNLSVALHSVLILLNAPVFWYSPRPGEPEDFTVQVARQLADMGLAALA
ncbi:TetR/AcrR family transcriptional regulator [Antarcticimicrobium luteum]|uniref:TetR/AcrR family transcriptional regulator n=1 Tax=Antarcticimicrobium luteum TaxID=2547397 RepID=A0A4R5V3C8_9RHOB|nr:TetR/AcrR family transcriptional regulator [Antarcticimicrobium luteum]TDK46171.1 TetR/AcrR family transcriptional regulator [Antarcticimicrobium luteum]